MHRALGQLELLRTSSPQTTFPLSSYPICPISSCFPLPYYRKQDGGGQQTATPSSGMGYNFRKSPGRGDRALKFNLIPLFKGGAGRTWNPAQHMLLSNPQHTGLPNSFLPLFQCPSLGLCLHLPPLEKVPGSSPLRSSVPLLHPVMFQLSFIPVNSSSSGFLDKLPSKVHSSFLPQCSNRTCWPPVAHLHAYTHLSGRRHTTHRELPGYTAHYLDLFHAAREFSYDLCPPWKTLNPNRIT